MATTKKTVKGNNKKKKEFEEISNVLENNMQKINGNQKFENTIKNKKDSIKEDLMSQLISQGKFGKHFDDMIEDYLYLVDLKERLKKDIDDNGIRYKTTGGNGFTTYKPNESCERLLKTNAQMLKILQDLDLKAPDEGGEDEGDDLL